MSVVLDHLPHRRMLSVLVTKNGRHVYFTENDDVFLPIIGGMCIMCHLKQVD